MSCPAFSVLGIFLRAQLIGILASLDIDLLLSLIYKSHPFCASYLRLNIKCKSRNWKKLMMVQKIADVINNINSNLLIWLQVFIDDGFWRLRGAKEFEKKPLDQNMFERRMRRVLLETIKLECKAWQVVSNTMREPLVTLVCILHESRAFTPTLHHQPPKVSEMNPTTLFYILNCWIVNFQKHILLVPTNKVMHCRIEMKKIGNRWRMVNFLYVAGKWVSTHMKIKVE